jgi:4-hydroxybenzoate polyprenyltransferase
MVSWLIYALISLLLLSAAVAWVMGNTVEFLLIIIFTASIFLVATYPYKDFPLHKAPCTGKSCRAGFITHQIVDKCVCLEEAK